MQKINVSLGLLIVFFIFGGSKLFGEVPLLKNEVFQGYVFSVEVTRIQRFTGSTPIIESELVSALGASVPEKKVKLPISANRDSTWLNILLSALQSKLPVKVTADEYGRVSLVRISN